MLYWLYVIFSFSHYIKKNLINWFCYINFTIDILENDHMIWSFNHDTNSIEGQLTLILTYCPVLHGFVKVCVVIWDNNYRVSVNDRYPFPKYACKCIISWLILIGSYYMMKSVNQFTVRLSLFLTHQCRFSVSTISFGFLFSCLSSLTFSLL